VGKSAARGRGGRLNSLFQNSTHLARLAIGKSGVWPHEGHNKPEHIRRQAAEIVNIAEGRSMHKNERPDSP
jgi:hypothetical protein